MQKVIQTHPAVDYVQGDGVYASGETMALPFETVRFGTMYKRFQVGSIAGHARQEDECPIKAVNECKQKMIDFPYMGHKLAWAFGLSVSITSGPTKKVVIPAQDWNDVIVLDGVQYTLVPAANQNVHLEAV